MSDPDAVQDRHTPLHGFHVARGARMVPFAGYQMPVQYPTGIIAEHTQTRERAGLFDVSHMGQAWIDAADGNVCALMERLVPGDLERLAHGRIRYTQFTNARGGILDDLMLTRFERDGEVPRLFTVVNAGCKDQDFAHIEAELGDAVVLTRLTDRALIAVQGPKAAECVESVVTGVSDMAFMSARRLSWQGADLIVSRCGYTGEDGFEISVPEAGAQELAEQFVDLADVEPIGLGARDSLRLEAGLCLYGHDITTDTTPIEAGLEWSISKRRREQGGFPGAERILAELQDGPARRRVGIRPEGRAPAREGTPIVDGGGTEIGTVTSGGFAPSIGAPIAMGYVDTASSADGTRIGLMVRGKEVPAEIVAMPFVPQRYYRAPK